MTVMVLRLSAARWLQVEESLRSRGHELLLQDDVGAALSEFACRPTELVVVDLTGDCELGLEFCRRLRETEGGAWAVILAVTADNHSQVVNEAVRAGVDDYLSTQDAAQVCAIRIALAEYRYGEKQSRRDILGRLHRAESRLQEILETAPDAIVGCGSDGTISLMNEQAVRLTGYDRAELLGRLIEDLLPESFREVHVGYRNRFFAHPASRPMGVAQNLKLRRKNGAEIDVDICLGYQEDGNRVVAVAAIRDITERRRMEEELRLAKQETERAYERIRREIEAAARVQQALLPTSLPRTDRVRFAFRYHPCADLGGDALGVFWLNDKQIGLYLLDVSGHGVAASLLSVALARQLAPGNGGMTPHPAADDGRSNAAA